MQPNRNGRVFKQLVGITTVVQIRKSCVNGTVEVCVSLQKEIMKWAMQVLSIFRSVQAEAVQLSKLCLQVLSTIPQCFPYFFMHRKVSHFSIQQLTLVLVSLLCSKPSVGVLKAILFFLFSFYTSKSQLLCNSFTPRIKLAGRKVGIFLIYIFLLACPIPQASQVFHQLELSFCVKRL